MGAKSTSAANAKGTEMSVKDWLSDLLNLKPKPELKAERTALVKETYDKVTEVKKLREEVLEGRNFPIASYLRGETTKPVSRRRGITP